MLFFKCARIILLATFNTALYLITKMQLIAIMHTCMYVTSLLCDQFGNYSDWSVFAYCMFVSQRKYAENTFIKEESTRPV
jgi:hypothetical protein